ncbi:MAG: ABC transporter permease [Methanobacteriales archaeon HGW-Methanobacteriales-1]|jgi:ABC-2 type transport system permease protein|nr:MAG: ABC transporter permease [Methanobacteriales archaeon HGW-Methanobacteriales-1]
MNIKRTLNVTKKVFRDIKNDKRTIGLIFLAPIFAMFIFGLAFSGEVKDVNIGVINHDQGFITSNGKNLSLSNKIIANIDPSVLNIKYYKSEKEAVNQVKSGQSYGVIIFPENFTQDAFLGFTNPSLNKSTQITIKADESVVNVKNAIMDTISDSIDTTVKEEGIKSPVSINSEPIYGKDATFIDFFVPGIMAFVVYLLTTLLTLLAFVGERTSRTLDRLLSTPLHESEIVGGYGLAFGIIGTLQAAFLLTVAILAFNIMIVGNVVLAFLIVALLAVVSQSLGILLSSLAKREAQAIQFIPFVILPVFLLSGVFWPVEAIPIWLRPISYLVPPTYAVDACRGVMLKGWGFAQIWSDFLALILFAVFFLLLATWSLKRKS